MRVNYSAITQRLPTGFRKIFIPYLNIKLKNGFREFQTRALIDSGASITLVNSEIAENLLKIDWEKGLPFVTFGITGKSETIFINKIDIEINGLQNSSRTIEIGVIKSDNFGVLLGQIGFFEFFNVAFCYSKKYFYINPSY
ncbi:MAG: retroviral-like aspartic protease [Ignavibacteria bacterium]|nr:retroviral-like aspartic protease [Ignavibacteria bacterium]